MRNYDSVCAAFSALPPLRWVHRTWLNTYGSLAEDADEQLRPGEAVLHAAVGQTGWGTPNGIVLTTQRVGVLTMDTVKWVERSNISRVSHMPVTLQGEHLAIYAATGNLRWWKLRPKGIGRAISFALRQPPQYGAAPGSGSTASNPVPVVGRGWGETAATFHGGEFKGNVARAGAGVWSPLGAGATVKIKLSSDDQVSIHSGGVLVARYELGSPCLTVDSIGKVGRSLRTGRLASTALATLAVGPLGLVGLLGSTKRVAKEALVLVVDDGPDCGLFSFTKADVGHRIRARQSHADDHADEPVDDESQLAQLERLVSLRDAGALTEEEFVATKRQLLDRM